MSMTRRIFLKTAAALAAPAVVPASLFGRADPLRKVDEFWAKYFGCSVRDLNGSRTLVLPHKALAGYPEALIFRHAASCIVSVPHTVPEIERSRLRNATPEEACDPRFLARVFSVGEGWVSGPHDLGIADRSTFTPVESLARRLSEDDRPALETLAGCCGEGAWYRSRIFPRRGPLFGLFEGRDLVAIAGSAPVEETIAFMGSLVHPAHRGEGLARPVLSAAMAGVFEKGLVPAWRTPSGDERAVALGRSLGFRPYATRMDVQLSPDEF